MAQLTTNRANKSGVYAKALYRAMATKRFRQIGQGEHARQCYIRLGFTLVGARLHKLEDVVAAVQDYDEAWRRFTAA